MKSLVQRAASLILLEIVIDENVVVSVSAGAASRFLDGGNIISVSADVDCLALGQSSRVIGCVESLLADDVVYLCERLGEGLVNIQGFLSGCFHEKQALLLCKIAGFLSGNGHQVSEICLVPHQHDHDVAVRVLSELLQPSSHTLVRRLPCHVVHQQRPHRASIVSTRDGTRCPKSGP